MDINSNNPLIDQLPTQNEVYQSHNNNEQTPSNYIPPPIYANNNIQNETNKDINDNNEDQLSSLEAPPAYDNFLTLDVKDPLSQDNIYLNNKPPQSTGRDQISQENNSEVEEPVYQLNVLPHENYDRDSRPCCECCCGDCCCYCDRCNEDCCGECSRCCSTCCRNIDWAKVFMTIIMVLAAAGRALK
jgi:hypothetical protein